MKFVVQVGEGEYSLYLCSEPCVWTRNKKKAAGFATEIAAMQAFLKSENASVVVWDGEPDQK